MQDQRTEKPCRKCGDSKPLDQFHRNRAAPDGLTIWCKQCTAAAGRAWRERNSDKVRERYLANKEQALERTQAWRARNPDHGRSYMAQRRAADPRLAMEARLRTRGLPFAPEDVDYALIINGDPCSYCGGPGGELDHILPTEAGGTNEWSNITAACRRCNARKAKRPLLDALIRGTMLTEMENWATRWGEAA